MWTWGGISFGYRERDSLFTHDGVEVGRFRGREIFGSDGRYLGEAGTGGDASRLITNAHKRALARERFIPTLAPAQPHKADRPGLPLYSGHVDFPSPLNLKAAGSYAAAPA